MTVEQPHGWLATLLPFAVVGVVLALRFRSMSKERPLNLGAMWIVPLIYLALVGAMFAALPPPLSGWELTIAGLVIGAVIGWYRGRTIRVWRDEESGKLLQRASPLAMLLLAAIVVLKLGARSIFGEAAATQPGSPAMLLTDAFLGFALGLLTATRVELYIRARKLLGHS
jgi:hypothetical protein